MDGDTSGHFQPEKSVWTEADFENMCWHDVHVHSMAFDPEGQRVLFDLDYIFKWVSPATNSGFFSFWISPSTLVFSSAIDFRVCPDPCFAASFPLEGFLILDLLRTPLPPHASPDDITPFCTWTLECIEGKITFTANGFSQFTRRAPVLCEGQRLSPGERGGFSFATPPTPEGV
jgi:hypothetical protein